MYAIVLEHSGFFCDVNKHACQEKMYAVNKMPLGIWVGAGWCVLLGDLCYKYFVVLHPTKSGFSCFTGIYSAGILLGFLQCVILGSSA